MVQDFVHPQYEEPPPTVRQVLGTLDGAFGKVLRSFLASTPTPNARFCTTP